MDFTGANVANVTIIKPSDIFLKVVQTFVGTVNVPQSIIDAGGALKAGTLLRSDDAGAIWDSLTTPAWQAGSYDTDVEVYHNGHIWTSDADANIEEPGVANWTDNGEWNPNGILYTDAVETKKTSVVLTGEAKEKYLTGIDAYLKIQLFNNKLIVK